MELKKISTKDYKIKIKKQVEDFKEEVKKHTATAITAAFGFLIALSWRTPIQNSVNKLIGYLGLTESAIYYEYLSAVFITVVAVFALMAIAKWTSKE